MIAPFIATEIPLEPTSWRSWSNREAIGAPALSVIVLVAGSCPVRRPGAASVVEETAVAESPANPATTGKSRPASSTPATTVHAARRTTAVRVRTCCPSGDPTPITGREQIRSGIEGRGKQA